MQCFVLSGNYTQTKWAWDLKTYHHLSRVCRIQLEDILDLVIPDQFRWTVRVIEITPEFLFYERLSEVSLSSDPFSVTLFQCLPKGDKLELIVDLCTQAGVSAIVPIISERTIVKWDLKKQEKQLERLSQIALSASEQSHRNTIPSIHSFLKLSDLSLFDFSSFDVLIVAWEDCIEVGFSSALLQFKPGCHIGILIGPEGGLSSREVYFLSALGFCSVSLGSRILRVEGAGFYVLAQLQAFLSLK